MRKNPYKVLIVEDDHLYSAPLQVAIGKSEDFRVLAVTDGAKNAWKYIKSGLPDVVIADLELAEGEGIELLAKVQENAGELPVKPYLLVVTSNTSSRITARLHAGLADSIIRKTNRAFGPEMVLTNLRNMAPFFQSGEQQETMAVQSNMEKEEMIRTRISVELDRYYMPHDRAARNYLTEVLYLLLQKEDKAPVKIGEYFAKAGEKFGKNRETIDKSIARLIKKAFERTGADDLREAYPAYVNLEHGAPGNKEFLLVITEKIQSEGWE